MHNLLNQISLYPAFIFDMDGTLINSEIWHHKAWNHMVQEFGCPPLSDETLIAYGGLPTEVISQKVIDTHNLSASVEQMSKRKTDLYLNEYMPKAEPFPFFADLLKELSASGKRIAVATSSHQKEARYLLEKNGLMPYIHALVTGEMVQKGKPNPDIYLLAAHKLNVEAHDCLVFEDTIVGMAGCKNARMSGIKVFDGAFDCDHIISPDELYEPREHLL